MDLRGKKPKELRNPETTLRYLGEELRDVHLAITFFATRQFDESRPMFDRLSEQEVIVLYNDLGKVIDACKDMQSGLDYLKRSRPLTKN